MLAQFRVDGRPRTKGSLKVITPRGRKPMLIEDHAHSLPWRKRIKSAIIAQVPAVTASDHRPFALPVRVHATFLFERLGPSAQLLPWPVVNAGINANGDLDKLLRNLLDAMKDARLIADDSLVVELASTKKWVDVWAEDADLIALPGINVKVWEAGGDPPGGPIPLRELSHCQTCDADLEYGDCPEGCDA